MADEDPWEVRAQDALDFVRARVKDNVQVSVNSFELRDKTLLGSATQMIAPFVGRGKSLREEKAQWALIAVLVRELWPRQLPTDKAAREACPVPVLERSITRWKTKLRELRADIRAAVQAAESEADGYLI